MNPEHRFFIVDDGPVLEIYEAFIAERESQFQARQDFAEEFGGTATYGNSHGIAGLFYEGGATPPEGWQKVGGQIGIFKPPKGNAGKAIRKRMAELECIGLAEFHHRVHGGIGVFGGQSSIGHGIAIRYTFPEMIGGVLVLKAPGGIEWESLPEGVREIKASEYWKMKEENPENELAESE